MNVQYLRLIGVFLLTSILFVVGGVASLHAEEQGDEIQLAHIHGKVDLFSSAPTSIIIDLEQPSMLQAKQMGISQTAQHIEQHRDQAIEALIAEVGSIQIKQTYEQIIAGFAIDIPGNLIPHLLSVPGIQAIYPVMEYSVNGDTQMETLSLYQAHEQNNLAYIGADVLHAAGVTGEGVRIALLGTGADYTHPAISHAFSDYRGMDVFNQDKEPIEPTLLTNRDEYQVYQGTHMAAIIAGQGKITGVAPDASLKAYRVIGSGGRGTTAQVLEGLEHAYLDEHDIIHLGFQSRVRHPDWALIEALAILTAEDVLVLAGAGNAGPSEASLGMPNLPEDVLTAGSLHMPQDLYRTFLHVPGEEQAFMTDIIGYPNAQILEALHDHSYALAHLVLNEQSNIDERIEQMDVQDKVVMVRFEEELTFTSIVEELSEAGAQAVVFYHLEGTHISGRYDGLPLPTFQMNERSLRHLADVVSEGHESMSFQVDMVRHIGATIATSSSRGPDLYQHSIGIDLVAPGVNILSAAPGEFGDKPQYTFHTGTGIAAAHIAGAAALLKQAYPEWTAKQISQALMNSAELIGATQGEYYGSISQGAGSLRVDQAYLQQTLISPNVFSDTIFYHHESSQLREFTFSIDNLSNENRIYEINVLPIGKKATQAIIVDQADSIKVDAQDKQDVSMNLSLDAIALGHGHHEVIIEVVDDDGLSIQLPMIIFVEQHNLSVLSNSSAQETNNTHMYCFHVLVPSGADYLHFMVFDGQRLTFKEVAGSYTSVPPGNVAYEWASPQNREQYPPGTYHVYVYAEREGISEQLYVKEIIIED